MESLDLFPLVIAVSFLIELFLLQIYYMTILICFLLKHKGLQIKSHLLRILLVYQIFYNFKPKCSTNSYPSLWCGRFQFIFNLSYTHINYNFTAEFSIKNSNLESLHNLTYKLWRTFKLLPINVGCTSIIVSELY